MGSVVERGKESLAEGIERLGRWGGDVRFTLNMGILFDIATDNRDSGNSAGTVLGETNTRGGFGDAEHSIGKVGEAFIFSDAPERCQTKRLWKQSRTSRFACSISELESLICSGTRCTQGELP
jgi:hypothetical protein